jgi:hypothetical protein
MSAPEPEPTEPKSADKTTVIGRPFLPGVYDPTRQGRGPAPGAPNAGRPRNSIREKCRRALQRSQGIKVLERIISGDLQDQLETPTGTPIIGQTANKDRIAAIKWLGDRAEPPTQKIDLSAMVAMGIQIIEHDEMTPHAPAEDDAT